MSQLRFAYAGDRDVAAWVLEYIIGQGMQPQALFLSAPDRASHAGELRALCPFLEPERIVRGSRFRQPEGLAFLRELDLDYLVCVHFPYIVPGAVLSIPRLGVLNLHPAHLPYNRGWHTPSWAILEQTSIGATLHFMDEGVDTGDIIHQKRLAISPGDTAHTLYKRLRRLEFEVFQEAWPRLVSGTYERQVQDPAAGTEHKRQELFADEIQRIEPDDLVRAGDLIRRLRALTTSDAREAAYYQVDGRRYHIQVTISEENAAAP